MRPVRAAHRRDTGEPQENRKSETEAPKPRLGRRPPAAGARRPAGMADFPEEASTRWFQRIGQPEAIGALRFMPDGSFLLRPGPQPDVLSLDCIANQVVLSVSISRMSGGRYLMQQHKRGDDLVAPLEYGSLAEMLARNRRYVDGRAAPRRPPPTARSAAARRAPTSPLTPRPRAAGSSTPASETRARTCWARGASAALLWGRRAARPPRRWPPSPATSTVSLARAALPRGRPRRRR